MSAPADLLLPDLLRALTMAKPITVQNANGTSGLLGAKQRQFLRDRFVPSAVGAQKFLFDSGSDHGDTVSAVRETALEMVEAGLFRMPAPVVWIEDPFDDESPMRGARNCYHCVERRDHVEVSMFVWIGPGSLLPRGWLWQGSFGRIPLIGARGTFDIGSWERPEVGVVEIGDRPDLPLGAYMAAKQIGEAVYSVKKFVVTLGTKQAVRERVEVPGGPRAEAAAARARRFPYTIIRVPSFVPEGTGAGGRPHRPRSCHLVRGYVWGKNTRPKEEQRWVEPFFRGDAALGTAPRSHYVIKQGDEERGGG